MNSILRGLKEVFTDDEGDFDVVLFGIVFSLAAGTYFTYRWGVAIEWKTFDPEKYGMMIATILGAGGLGYAAKRVGDKRAVGADSHLP